MSEEVFDLDAAYAAQADAAQTPWPFKFRGKEYQIERPVPYKAVFAFAQRDDMALIEALFGDQAEEVVEARIHAGHLARLLEELFGGPGKSSKSSGSSRTGGKSRSTSKGTTGSTPSK